MLENSDSKVVEWIAGVPKDPYVAAAPAWRDAFRERLLSFDFKEYTRRDPQWGGVALVFAADHAGRFADSELTARIEAEIIRVARAADLTKWHADYPLPLWLIRAMLPLSIVNQDETATAGNYFARLEKRVLAQPSIAKVLYRAMGLWKVSLPFAQQPMFWRLLVTIRALRRAGIRTWGAPSVIKGRP